MVSQAGGDGWCALNPMHLAAMADIERQTQALVPSTEVVDRADKIHASDERIGRACECSGTAGQSAESLAGGGVESLHIGRVDLVATFAGSEQALYQCWGTLNDPASNGEWPWLAAFHHLHQLPGRTRQSSADVPAGWSKVVNGNSVAPP